MRKKKRGAGRGGLAGKEKGGERCIRPKKERERERKAGFNGKTILVTGLFE